MTVEELKKKRKEKKKSFNAYAKRRNGVRDIVKKIDDKLDDDVSAINKKIDDCVSELKQGLKGSKKLSDVCSDLTDMKEKNPGSDGKMSSCRSNLKSEQTRLQNLINDLDREIDKLEKKIKEQGGTIYPWE